MKKLNNLFIFLAVLIISAACGTVQETTSSQEPEQSAKQTAKQSAKSDGKAEKSSSANASSVEKQADEAKPEEKKPEEKTNYDGLRYVGPAAADFAEGLGKYSSEGCESAIKSWNSAFEKDQANAQVAFNIAVCYERLKKQEESASWYEKSYLADSSFMKPLYNSALLYVPKSIKEKEQYFVQLVEKTADIVEKYNFLAWLYLQTGNMDSAEKYAKMVLKEDEQNADAVISLATSYFNKKMYELAESALETAEKWDPENFRLQRLYGFLLYRMGDTKGAATHLMKAVKSNPDLPEVRNILAVLAMKIEDYSTAKDHLEAALKIKSDFRAAKLNLALAYKGLDDFKNSRDILNELEQRTDLPNELKISVIFNKGLLYLDADVEGDKNPARFDTAVKYFNDYLKLIAKSKNFKAEKALVDGYIKEAGTEKKKLEFAIAAKAKAEKKKKAQEEEAKRFQQNKQDAFNKAQEAGTAEAWSKFLEEYPIVDENDTLSNTAKAKLDELVPPAPAESEVNAEGEAQTEGETQVPEEQKEGVE